MAALLASLRQATGPFRAAVAAGTLSAQRWSESHSQVGRTSYSGSHRSSNGGCCGADPSSQSLSPTTTTVTVSPAGVEAAVTEADLAAQVIATHYLLVSPPLPPVSMFLLLSFSATSAPILATATTATATTTTTIAAAAAADTASTVNANTTPSLDDGGAREEGSREGRRGGRKVLVAWGDEDAFTSVKKYRRWGDKMRGDTAAGEFVGVEVPGAGHFWAGDDLRHVVDAVDRWL